MFLARFVLIALVGLPWLGPAALAAAQTAQPKVFELEIADGRLVGPREVVRVSEGDRVELRWTSDAPVELHLHGYDVTVRVAPAAAGVMAFDAHATGRFPITTHGSGEGGHGHGHATLLYLEVHPR